MIKKIPYGDREEWLAIRKKYIGGSDAGAVIGMNPYKSAYELWAEKTGKLPAFEGNMNTEVGTWLEGFVADKFEEVTGKKVQNDNFVNVNDVYPFACANIDRKVVGERAFLEIKTTSSVGVMRQLRNENEFPAAYYAQCVHYLAVTGLDKAYLAVLVLGTPKDFKVYELERDEAEIAALMTAEADFWNNHVLADKAPCPDGSESASETIAALYPDSTDESIDLTAYKAELDTLKEIKTQIKELDGIKSEVENHIKAVMENAGRGACDGYKVSYASSERKTFDTKRFAAEHPEIALDGYYKVTSVRSFRVSEVAL